jgi:hypothetical protein
MRRNEKVFIWLSKSMEFVNSISHDLSCGSDELLVLPTIFCSRKVIKAYFGLDKNQVVLHG